MHLRQSPPSVFSSLPAPSLSAILRLALLLALAVVVTACDRPQEEDCKQAVANIRNLYDTAGTSYGIPPRAAIRSCRGSASRETVECMIAAKTVEDLENCKGDEFLEAMIGTGDQADGDSGDDQTEADEAPTEDKKSTGSQGTNDESDG